jgi:hypothetical protein
MKRSNARGRKGETKKWGMKRGWRNGNAICAGFVDGDFKENI